MAWKHWSVGLLLASVGAAADPSVFSQASNDSLLWGPYRPNLYFGVRPRLPKSVSTALLWARVEDYSSVQHNVRFTCEQHAGMAGYGWDKYDPRVGGVQTVHDKDNGIDMETSFVKFDDGRGGWGARIKGTPRDDAQPMMGSQGGVHELKTAVWFTISVDGIGSVAPEDIERGEDRGYEGNVVFEGQTSDLGDFKITITAPDSNAHPVHAHETFQEKPIDHTLVHSLRIPEEMLWQSLGVVYSSMKPTIDKYVEVYGESTMPPPWQTYTIANNPGPGNVQLVQKVFEGPFEFDVIFTPNDQTRTSDDITKALNAASKSFDDKFAQVFQPKAPFSDSKHVTFGQSLFSNLIGGIGYFHGDQLIDRSYASEYDEDNEGFWMEAEEARGRNQQKLEGPFELFTSIPSRPFFPRGFLWDEGFHLLPMLEWDPELVMQIVSSWYNTMDDDGWIPREQILGAEARSKVPVEFQVQYPHYANPPTLFMILGELLDHIGGPKAPFFSRQTTSSDFSRKALPDSSAVTTWLQALYPLLQRNYEWYRRTQVGDIKSYDREAFSSKEGYRWRGRTPRHILTSGLDDYPRAQPPHPGELHVDLMSWMGLMTDALHRVAKFLGETEDAAKYNKISEAIRHNVDDLHWSEENKAYCDATVDAFEESIHVCHKGYISLFPFMAGLVGPKHAHLKDVLDLIADEEELWSPHGVRSLSRNNELYGTDENYWRSPVWMNMNYLIVKQLYETARQPGPQKDRAGKLYSALRKNLVDTVYKSWLETGFAWEQYNPDTGAGQRTQHFTGWTSLVVKIMSMPERVGQGGHEEL